MKYHIFTLGCQMNISDSQRISSKLKELKYKSAPEKEADLVIVNACSVRQHAVDRIWGKIKKWTKENKKILITGCVVKDDQNKFRKKDLIYFKINELPKLKNILSDNSYVRKNIRISSKEVRCSELDYFNIPSNSQKATDKNKQTSNYFQSHKIAYVPIMTGCDNFCSYCAVPYTRGREVSRPMKDIVAEVKQAIKLGHKDILLLGQNVNSYGNKLKSQNSKVKSTTKKLNDNSEFIELLRIIDSLPGNFTFNFMSSNPHDMGDELIGCFAKLKKWTKELHLAMQSGDDEILKKMNRKYTTNQFLKLIRKLETQIPKIKISTDIIVGFPGETNEQFNNTYKVCKKIGFCKAFISQYSPRPGTIASKLDDNISKEIKKQRWEKLNKLIN